MTQVVKYTKRNGKKRLLLLDRETAKNPDMLRHWGAWNGLSDWVNSLTDDQMARLYEIIDGPLPLEIKQMSDDELLAALQS